MTSPNKNQTNNLDSYIVASISYAWFIGFIIAILINRSKKNDFVTYHIRNMIGLLLLSIPNYILIGTGVSSVITNPINIVLLVLWSFGLVGALKDEKQEIPLLGKFFQDWFKSI